MKAAPKTSATEGISWKITIDNSAPTNGAVAKYADSRAAPRRRSALTSKTMLAPP